MNFKQLNRKLLKDKKYRELYYKRDMCFDLSIKILNLRLKERWTLEQMSKKTGIAKWILENAESTGEVDMKFIRKLCDKTGKKFIFYFK